MTSLRKHELRALRQLVEAHDDTPEMWGTEHWSVAAAAAVTTVEEVQR